MQIGKGTIIEKNAWVDPGGKVKIGEETYISGEVVIYTHHHNEARQKWITSKMERKEIQGEIEIGNNVFIGRRSVILSSCNRIGNNVVIGACSVVTKDIPDNEIWAGNPARKIRSRKFDKEGNDLLAHTGNYNESRNNRL